jgi:hypothetical protein
VVKEAVLKKAEIGKEISDAMAAGIEPYDRLRSELAAGQPTAGAESAANRAHGRVKHLRDDKLVREMLACEAELDRVLTAGQVAYLSEDVDADARGPADGDEPPARHGRIDRNLSFAVRILSKARRMSAAEFASEKAGLCREFVTQCIRQAGLDAKSMDPDAEAKRAEKVLERARSMDHAEYSGNRSDLAAELCPRRSDPRAPVYTARYVGGKPTATLGPSTRLLFSETALEVLKRKAGGT